MGVTVLPPMGFQARIPLLQILQVLDQLGERRSFKIDQPRLSQVMEQIANDPEKRGYYISQSLPRMQSRQGRETMLEWAGKKPEKEKLYEIAPGERLVTGAGEERARGLPKAGKAVKEEKIWIHHPQKKIKMQVRESQVSSWLAQGWLRGQFYGKTQGGATDRITNYTKAINQRLKKHGLKTGSILNPDGTVDIEALSRNKKAIYEVLKEKAAKGDDRAIEDLSRIDFWYSKIDQLTGIGTPEFKQMRKRTQKGLITHEFIPGKGLVPTGGR